MTADIKFFNKKYDYLPVKSLEEIGGVKLELKEHDKIYDINSIDSATTGDVVFLNNPKYAKDLPNCKASFVIISEKFIEYAPPGASLIIHSNPYYIYSEVIKRLYTVKVCSEDFLPKDLIMDLNIRNKCNISLYAYVHKDAIIGMNARIMANAVIESGAHVADGAVIGYGAVIKCGCVIGCDVEIEANSVIEFSEIGDNAKIGPGCAIGKNGFGFATENGVHYSILHLGKVSIGANVCIGSNTSIDRGSLSDTVVGDGVRIDNLVQLGHNVKIGAGSVIVSQVGIAGSSEIGKYSVLAGQVGVAGHIKIGDMVTVAAKSGVAGDLESGGTYAGIPAIRASEWRRMVIKTKRLAAQ